jgi:drug/metabolite transporter (DMT)-like permease
MADEAKPRCACARCRVRGLMGPVMLIAVGLIFLVGEYTSYDMGQLWPVLLIVAGVVLFAQTVASRAGHTGS